MQERDGLEMLVRAYHNQDELMIIEKKTGVPVARIEAWLRGGKLSKSDRELLCKDIHPEFTGTVKVG